MKKYIILILLLLFALMIKDYFINHQSRAFFALGFTDITKMSGLIEKKPVPIPYIDSYVEYPVVIGMFIWIMGSLTKNSRDYFLLTSVVLSFLSIASFYISEKLVIDQKKRNKLFIFWLLSPTFILFSVYNWDVLAVFFLLFSLYLFSKNKDMSASVFLTLGVWTKLFPIFLLPAIIFKRYTEKNYKSMVTIVVIFILISVVLNVPFAAKFMKGWAAFFTFSQARGPNIDSIWAGLFVISDKLLGPEFAWKNYYTTFINYFSNISLLLALGFVYIFAWKRKFTDLATLTLVGIILFLVTAKVYSPPYNFWIVPLIALIGISFPSFIYYELANVAVFYFIFQYFYETNILGRSMISIPWYKVAYFFVFLRHVALIILLKGASLRSKETS